MASGVIFDWQQFPLRGGGKRTVVYLKGCPLSCLWCANPESQASEPQLMVRAERCLDCGTCEQACERRAVLRSPTGSFLTDRLVCRACGACTEVCPSGARLVRGRTVSVEHVLAGCATEGEGVFSLSGGEPLLQPPFAAALLREARARGLRTSLETCGYAPWHDFARVLAQTDVVFFDLKHTEPSIHRRLTGVRNDLILANLERVVATGVRVVARLALVPGCTADGPTVLAVARLVKTFGIADLHLVPYHRHGEWKYLALGRGYPLDGAVPLSEEVVGQLRLVAEQVHGLRVRVGG